MSEDANANMNKNVNPNAHSEKFSGGKAEALLCLFLLNSVRLIITKHNMILNISLKCKNYPLYSLTRMNTLRRNNSKKIVFLQSESSQKVNN